MDKDIWLQITEDAISFKEVLILTSKAISVPPKYLKEVKLIDRKYKTRKTLDFKDLKKLHIIAISLWFSQYSASLQTFDFEEFSAKFHNRYQQIFMLLKRQPSQYSRGKNIDSKRTSLHLDYGQNLEVWKDFMSKLLFLDDLEQKAGKKVNKSLDADTKFAIISAIALVAGISLAIFVVLTRR